MKPVVFPGANTTLAKDQPEYLPLPAYWDGQKLMVTCWALSWRERFRLLWTGRLWHSQLTFGMALQPQRPSVERPEEVPNG